MTITTDGWFDWAERNPGPPDKKYTEANTARLFIPHSAVGYLNGWYSRLFSTERVSCSHGGAHPQGDYSPYASASVHLWNAYDGHLIQHYPIFVSCWASGSRHLNVNGVAMEHEGGFQPVSEPLRVGQIDTLERVLRDLAAFHGKPPDYWSRPINAADMWATLYEHNETTRFGGVYSSCPSGRIPWNEILRRLGEQEDDDMWVRHNRLADWFTGRFWPGGSGGEMQTKTDFALPDGVKAVRFGVDIQSGHIRWFDGDGVSVAGASSPRYSVVELFLNDRGTCHFFVEQDAVFNVLECLAYR